MQFFYNFQNNQNLLTIKYLLESLWNINTGSGVVAYGSVLSQKKRNSQETVWMKLIYSIEAKSQNGVDSIK